MARQKKTARKKTGGPGKVPRKQLATKPLNKKLTPAAARRNAAKANQAQQKNLGNPQTGGAQETNEVEAGYSSSSGDKALPENDGATHQKAAF